MYMLVTYNSRSHLKTIEFGICKKNSPISCRASFSLVHDLYSGFNIIFFYINSESLNYGISPINFCDMSFSTFLISFSEGAWFPKSPSQVNTSMATNFPQ